MKFCKECGQGNDDDASYCVQCGSPVPEDVEEPGARAREGAPPAGPSAAAAPGPWPPGTPPGPVPPPPPEVPAHPPYGWPAGYVPPPRPSRYDGMAIASFVLGLVGFVMWPCAPVTGVLAVVFGYVGRRNIAESSGNLDGATFCTVGIILGFVQIGIALAVLVVWLIVVIVANVTRGSAGAALPALIACAGLLAA